MYNPTDGVKPQRARSLRVGIQGRPKTGKTWAALTFPNPIVLDWDKNIPPGHPKFDSIIIIPFWDIEFCRKILNKPPNIPAKNIPKHEALQFWLEDNGDKFTEDQTLVWDSATYVGNFFDTWYEDHPIMSKQGQVNDFAPWKIKIAYFTKLHELIANLSCNFVCVIHEQWDYKDGIVVGIKPALTGAFGDVIAGRYNEWFRQVVDDSDKKTMIRKYHWQVKSSELTSAGGSLVSLIPPECNAIMADYNRLKEIIENGNKKIS